MTGKVSVVAAAAAIMVVAGGATVGQAAPPTQARAGDARAGAAATGATQADWPRLLKKHGKPRAASRWSKSQTKLARIRCRALLRKLDVVAVALSPMRQDGCGAAAPMKLISIGSKPRVVLSPAPIVNCDMIAGMHRWMQTNVQPLARRHLGAPIVQIDVMSSYSCRNAYGRKDTKLSQHARANALDIRGFGTTAGVQTALLGDWGPTRSTLQRRAVAATRAAHSAAKLAARSTVTTIARAAGNVVNAVTRNHAGDDRRRNDTGIGVSLGLRGTVSAPAMGFTDARMSNLGGPKSSRSPRNTSGGPVSKAKFLRAVHKGACRIFGTVLGPDANYAHRHHFHVDMAMRKFGPYCR